MKDYRFEIKVKKETMEEPITIERKAKLCIDDDFTMESILTFKKDLKKALSEARKAASSNDYAEARLIISTYDGWQDNTRELVQKSFKGTNTIVAQEMINKEPEADYITYGELSEKVGTMVFCEEMDKRYRNFIDMKYKNTNEISQEEINLLLNTYQWCIITKESTEYLQSETDELVYYDKELNVYAWAIGTCDMNTDWKNEPSTVKKI